MNLSSYEQLLALIAIFGETALVSDVINFKKELNRLDKIFV